MAHIPERTGAHQRCAIERDDTRRPVWSECGDDPHPSQLQHDEPCNQRPVRLQVQRRGHRNRDQPRAVQHDEQRIMRATDFAPAAPQQGTRVARSNRQFDQTLRRDQTENPDQWAIEQGHDADSAATFAGPAADRGDVAAMGIRSKRARLRRSGTRRIPARDIHRKSSISAAPISSPSACVQPGQRQPGLVGLADFLGQHRRANAEFAHDHDIVR